MHTLRAWALVVAAGTTTACGFTFERSSEIIDRRIIAIRAEPPELVGDGTPLPTDVEVTALVVEPGTGLGAPPSGIDVTWRRCSQFLGSLLGETSDGGRCDAEDARTLLQQGPSSIGEIRLTVPVPPETSGVLDSLASQNAPASIHLNAQLDLPSNDPAKAWLFGFKRIVLSPNLPAGRPANRNPRLSGVLFDGKLWEPDVPMPVEGPFEPEDGQAGGDCGDGETTSVFRNGDPPQVVQACAHKVQPLFDPGEAEPYRVQAFDGTIVDLNERLRFAWFTDTGSYNAQNTEMTDSRDGVTLTDPTGNRWNEPADQPPVGTIGRVWIVVRDGRGGASWVVRYVRFE